jgi:hypothetical protein
MDKTITLAVTPEEERAWKEKEAKLLANARQVGGTHYKDMAIEPWDVMQAVLTHAEFVGFLKGNIIKYSLRAGRKQGASDDADKARHYLQKLEEVERGL